MSCPQPFCFVFLLRPSIANEAVRFRKKWGFWRACSRDKGFKGHGIVTQLSISLAKAPMRDGGAMTSDIVLKDIVKRYRRGGQQIEVLQRLNLTVPAGAFLALMGPSGSGKT